MTQRNYSNTAVPSALSGSINNTDSVTTVSLQTALTGWPSTPCVASIDRGTSSEEVVLVTAISGLSATVQRGFDGTTKVVHANLAPFEHVASAIDYQEANTHVNATQGVHGIAPGSTVVGTTDTQSLTNKTLTAPTVTDLTNMQHSHATAAQGGNIPQSSVTGLTAALGLLESATSHASDIAALSATVTANDSAAVHKTGVETIAGAKTLSNLLTASAGIAATGPVTISGTGNTVVKGIASDMKIVAGTATPSFSGGNNSGTFTVTHSAGLSTVLAVVLTPQIPGGTGGWNAASKVLARLTNGVNGNGFSCLVWDPDGTNHSVDPILHYIVIGT